VNKVQDFFIGIGGAIFVFAINYLLAILLHKFKRNKNNSIESIKRYIPKLWILSMYMLVVILEEIICRSYILSYIDSISNIYVAIIGNSLVFVLFHFKYKTLQIFTLGIIFSFLLIITNNLLVPIIAHYLNNIMILYYKNNNYDGTNFIN
jgi:membrane protease YdiL (CAAX protease family)